MVLFFLNPDPFLSSVILTFEIIVDALIILGLRSENFMVSLRQSEPEIYHQLMGEYQDYMECTRAVQTGYYKRSVDNTAKYHLDTYSLDPYGKSNPKTQVITNLLKGAVQQTMEQQHQHQQQQQNQNSNTLWKKINAAVSSSILSPATSDVSNIGGSITQTGEKDLPILIKR